MANKEITNELEAKRESYYARVHEMGLECLWRVNKRLVPPVPDIQAVPHLFRYSSLRDLLLESGDLITTSEAQRRVLNLNNPGFGGEHRITNSLYAGLQLLLPGEIAPAHRHSPSALRFIMEGEGAYTSVDGEKAYMSPGDFIITPSMTWHDHGHEGHAPVLWMDGLDIPTVGAFGPMFFDQYPDEQFPETRPPGDSQARWGANMRPANETWEKPESPVISYPYPRSRGALEKMRKADDWDPYHGLKMQYIDPTTGGSPMPTISAFLQLLPASFRSELYQTTEGMVYVPVEGVGRAVVGDGDNEVTLDWQPWDIFVIPCWYPHRFEADQDCVLFSYSDRVSQQKLGIWRERRGNEVRN